MVGCCWGGGGGVGVEDEDGGVDVEGGEGAGYCCRLRGWMLGMLWLDLGGGWC